MSRIGLINYGFGNHASVRGALQRLGHFVLISDDQSVLDTCDVLVLPGVGGFSDGIGGLRARQLDEFVRQAHDDQRPLVGICLGMQMLGTSSTEGAQSGEEIPGLDIIPGAVVRLDSRETHTGWNNVVATSSAGLRSVSMCYFNHAYVFQAAPEYVRATSSFAGQTFPSIVGRGRTIGFQFHPEKSQEDGINILGEAIGNLV